MKNLLVGNGINIQFGKSDYGSQQIVLRILKNCDRDDFPTHIIIDCPHYMKSFIGKLYLESRSIINGMYDSYVTCTPEKNSLAAFKEPVPTVVLPTFKVIVPAVSPNPPNLALNDVIFTFSDRVVVKVILVAGFLAEPICA